MEFWAKKKCVPCEGIGKALDAVVVKQYLPGLKGWQIAEDGKSIYRDFVLKSFVEAVNLVNTIKGIAEIEMHHPDIHLTRYKHLKVVLYTHALNGITENDLILAAKINEAT